MLYEVITKDKKAIILATTDITEMLEKEAQLLQADKMTMLGEMSAGVAHELNQPLNAIKMGNEYLKMMVEEGKVIPEQDLLEVARITSYNVCYTKLLRMYEKNRRANSLRRRNTAQSLAPQLP